MTCTYLMITSHSLREPRPRLFFIQLPELMLGWAEVSNFSLQIMSILMDFNCNLRYCHIARLQPSFIHHITNLGMEFG